ncbi:molybdopterin-dependent oxidoreductase [Halobaculum gomorrense]|uniref:DMSO/TMAO reductase YedYZ, molybdopterin-dependent catalytic subunit n=1 Tax=Halobaculum gomorrense TaxID=43928 RepID=A0A1M5JFI7_9EURY|nr:molybdopterin-dependent oxidoreductase [Halobaculum gomorrense]SHG39342.1 DMSO/TMAO reductase YedYZ, molybdopterin-dependent catalytic subunit [Halobaculum gomorrense]
MGRVRRTVAGAIRSVEPPARVVDWAIAVCVAVEVASGLYSFTRGAPSGAWVFWLHSSVGLTLVALVGFKLWRVRRRVATAAAWDRFTPVSVLQAVVALAALATGVFWVLGGNVPVFAWTTLNLHVGLGVLLVPLVLWHLRGRYHSPREVDPDRRSALRVGALLVAGTVAWRATETADRVLGGASRRFTGSKPTGDLYDTETEGGGFPVTSWVADDPDPVDRGAWTLSVRRLVGEELDLGYDDLAGDVGGGDAPTAELEATLDCTSGWYTVQRWGGVRVGDLLDAAGADERARYVRFTSVTGYRWSLPIDEARDALLATHVRGSRLSHGHGGPARLVAPGRRGFQWVKWVESVEVRERGDPMQWLVTLVSGFD